MTFFINHEALNKISTSLKEAGTDLDGASGSAPTGVDGGCGTPAILGILSRLTDNAGQLVVAVNATGDAVALAESSYRDADGAGAESINEAMRTE